MLPFNRLRTPPDAPLRCTASVPCTGPGFRDPA